MTRNLVLGFAAVAVGLLPRAAAADGALLTGPFAAPAAVSTAWSAPAPRIKSPREVGRSGAPLLVEQPAVTAPVEAPPPADEAATPVPAGGGAEVLAAPDAQPEGADGERYADLWSRIRAGFGMREIDSPLVQRHEAWYLNRPEYVERMIERSRRYLFHIVEEVERRGMPTEIALLPMIESAYNPAAVSRMRAAGMWQFIPSTGRRYGLQQTWWYDGRRDVLAATSAALDYLQALHEQFGDWELALAAYNWGEGAVQRAIVNNRKARKRTDYYSLRMPRETRNYLPKLQAVKNIVSDPALLGMSLAHIPDRPYFAVVDAPAHIDVEIAAKLADVDVEEFRNLNPGHQRPVITPVANRQLLVPIDKVEIFHANLESNDQPLVTWQTYQLKKGEQFTDVATKFDISLERLKEVNGLAQRRRVRDGQMLLVPMGDDAHTNLDETYASSDFQAPADDYHKRTIYRVKSGDTLSSIARRYGTSVARLKEWNGLRGDMVRIDQRLTIWQEAPRGQSQRSAQSGSRAKPKAAAAGKPAGAPKATGG